MSIAFNCPQCGKAFQVGDDYAGRKARCRQCGLMLAVPKRSGMVPEVYGTPVDDEPAPRPSPRPGPKPRGASRAEARPAPPAPAAPAPPAVDVYGFDEVENDPGFEILDDEETGPPPPQRATSRRDKDKASGAPGLAKGLGGVAATAVVLAGMALRVYNRLSKPGAPLGAPARPAAPAAPGGFGGALEGGGAAVPPPGPSAMPAMPDCEDGREIEPGVVFQEVVIGPGRPRPGVPPGHGMTLYLYLPAGSHETHSLPCVLVAPAGSTLITGMGLGDGDRPEHVPWVRAGFAVLSYSLDGELSDRNAGDDEFRRASEAFLAARAGLTNAEVALAWLAARVPQVDPNRIYTAGHSSAATLALLLAEHDPRIKACAAFAPPVDLNASFSAEQKGLLRRAIPRVDAFFTAYNPKAHSAQLNVPLFLFVARDDAPRFVQGTEALAAELQAQGKPVTLVTVPNGGHYDPMIRQGLPRAIEWLRKIDQRL
jgi:dienelactone hydrolase